MEATQFQLAIPLAVSGLQVDYWEEIFKKQLATSQLQFKFENENIFNLVKQFSRDDRERIMLKDFLKIDRDDTKDTELLRERSVRARDVFQSRKKAYHEKRLLSAGLTIRGFLFTNKMKTCLKPRENILVPKPNAKINCESDGLHETDQTVAMSGRTEREFEKALETMGYPAAVSITNNEWGFYRHARCPKKDTKQNDKCVQVSVYPRAQCEISQETVQPSEHVMKGFEVLQKKLNNITDVKEIQNLCGNFLETFGSHVPDGTVEFGYIHKQNIKERHSEMAIEKTCTPQLLEDISKWSVLTRSHHFETDFSGIWELLSDKDIMLRIPDADRLRYELRRTWIDLYSPASVSTGAKKIDSHIRELASCGLDLTLDEALECAQHLYTSVAQLYTEDRSTSYWVDTLKYREQISKVLYDIIQNKDRDTEKHSYLCSFVHELVELTGKANFPRKKEIIECLDCKVKEELPQSFKGNQISDIPSVLMLLREIVNSTLPDFDVETLVLADLALIFNKAKLSIEKKEDHHQVSFLVALFSMLCYAGQGHSVGLDTKMVDKWTGYWQEYETYKAKDDLSLNAFLVKLHFLARPNCNTPDGGLPINLAYDTLRSRVDETFKGLIISPAFEWQRLMQLLEEPSSEVVDEAIEDNGEWGQLLKQFGLGEYFPGRISFREVMEKQAHGGETSSELQNLPWVYLKQILMLNGKARENIVDEFSGGEISDDEDSSSGSSCDSDDIQDMQHNPLDIFLLVFACCDLPLRQILVRNMLTCNLAFPFIFPSGPNSILTHSLWPMRSTMAKMNSCDTSLAEAPLDIVTFIRFGKSNLPKSKMLNSILNQDNTFLEIHDHDIPEGKVSGGLIEAFTKAPDDQNKNHTMFLNLRGNAALHKVQVEVLCKISSVVVACVDKSELGDEAVLETAKMMKRENSSLIVLLSDSDKKLQSKKKEKDPWGEFQTELGISDETKIKRLRGFKGSNITTKMKDKLKEAIKECLENEEPRKLTNALEDMHLFSVEIDESDAKCQQGRQLAEEIPGTFGVSIDTSQYVPREHLEKFIVNLKRAFDAQCLQYFLQWLTNRSCKLSVCQTTIGTIEPNTKLPSDDKHKQTEQVHVSAQELCDAEYLLHEAVLIYGRREGLELPTEVEEAIKWLPDIAAYLVLNGYPIPLIFGDNTVDLLGWITDVFKSLDIQLRKKNILITSVIESPSSSKSILFDILFGSRSWIGQLEDRCGAYMSLGHPYIPGSSSLDQIVRLEVIGSPKAMHALTTVVGLSDVILFKSEGDSEESPILKATVQTMLMLNPLNKRLGRDQTLVFIGDCSKNKSTEKQKEDIRQTLDRITEEAHASGPHTVQETLKFDPQKDVWLVPQPLQGDLCRAISSQEQLDQISEFIKAVGSHSTQEAHWRLVHLHFFLSDIWNEFASKRTGQKFESTLVGKALSVVHSHFTDLQCALGALASCYGSDDCDIEMESLSHFVRQHKDMSDLILLNRFQKMIQSSQLYYYRWMEKYVNNLEKEEIWQRAKGQPKRKDPVKHIGKDEEKGEDDFTRKGEAEQDLEIQVSKLLTEGREHGDHARNIRLIEKRKHDAGLEEKLKSQRAQKTRDEDSRGKCAISEQLDATVSIVSEPIPMTSLSIIHEPEDTRTPIGVQSKLEVDEEAAPEGATSFLSPGSVCVGNLSHSQAKAQKTEGEDCRGKGAISEQLDATMSIVPLPIPMTSLSIIHEPEDTHTPIAVQSKHEVEGKAAPEGATSLPSQGKCKLPKSKTSKKSEKEPWR